MATLKQLKTIESMPKNGYNLAKSMRENGYTKASSLSGATRKLIQNHTKQLGICDPERIKRDINYVYKLAKKEKDITNMSRNIEHRAKIAGMIVDRAEVDNKNAEKVVIVYGTKPAIDTTPPVNKPVDNLESVDNSVDKC